MEEGRASEGLMQRPQNEIERSLWVLTAEMALCHSLQVSSRQKEDVNGCRQSEHPESEDFGRERGQGKAHDGP